MAKQPSLSGHARIAKRLARLIPFYDYGEARFFDSDGAPADVAERRRSGFFELARRLRDRAPETIRVTEALAPAISDLQFTGVYRVPFQYSRVVREHLKI